VLSEPRVRLNTGTGGSQFGGVPVDFALLRNHILQARRSANKVTPVITRFETRAQQGSRVLPESTGY
jgi:hypothetical protein